MNPHALFLMTLVGIVGGLLTSLFLIEDHTNQKLRKFIIIFIICWVVFWCGPPLFKLWTVGVLG